MARIDKLHHDLIEAFKSSGYNINENQKQITNLCFELELNQLPLLSIIDVDYKSSLTKGLKVIKEIPSINNIITHFDTMEMNIAPCVTQMKDTTQSIFSYEFVRKPLQDFTRVKYASGDKTYLDTLWNSANFKKKENREEAKNLLEKELKDVPKFGFILNVNFSLQNFETFFEHLFVNSILAYLVAECTHNFLPVSLYIHCSQFRVYETNFWDQVQTNPHKYSVPYIEFSDSLKEKAKFVKSGDLKFTEFIEQINFNDITIKNYRQ